MEIDSFIQRADYLEKEIVILERKIKRYPKGRLACVHNGKYKTLKTYNDNGIYQDINLICTYETSETPLDMRDVQNQIKRFLL